MHLLFDDLDIAFDKYSSWIKQWSGMHRTKPSMCLT